MAEWTVVPSDQCVTIPDEIDDITAAAIANHGMSSWAAYQERAHLKAGETVLINGGTGTAGRLAVRIARYLGAKKVIATGRHQEALNEVGADATILLQEDASALEASFKAQFDAGIDVVIDYLWGASAVCILRAAAKVGPRSPLRFVQIGSTTGGDITLPSSVLRSIPIEITGSGLGSVSSPRLVHVIGELLRAAATEGFTLATSTVPLSEVEQAWNRGDKAGRIVFTMNGAH
jgi:NADPH:quinone reductase-like Zn-dependent oxidoreductase